MKGLKPLEVTLLKETVPCILFFILHKTLLSIVAHFSHHRDGCTSLTVVNMPDKTLSQECIMRAHLRLAVLCDILCSSFAITAVAIKIQTAKKLYGCINKWASCHSWRGTEYKMIDFLAQQD